MYLRFARVILFIYNYRNFATYNILLIASQDFLYFSKSIFCPFVFPLVPLFLRRLAGIIKARYRFRIKYLHLYVSEEEEEKKRERSVVPLLSRSPSHVIFNAQLTSLRYNKGEFHSAYKWRPGFVSKSLNMDPRRRATSSAAETYSLPSKH